MGDGLEQTDTWRVGDVSITRNVDLKIGEFPVQVIFDGLTNEQVRSVHWLQPHYATPEGALKKSFHAYVVRSKGSMIIVDTCSEMISRGR
jgi:hypothetical protein